MDARVSDFFGSENGHGSGSQGAASNAKSGNGYGVSQRKAFLKSKKSKTRFARNLKPSNNTPYLPPEVSEAKIIIKRYVCQLAVFSLHVRAFPVPK